MRFAIIGAGLAGLTAAYEIHKADPTAQIDVLEAGERIGGKLLRCRLLPDLPILERRRF